MLVDPAPTGSSPAPARSGPDLLGLVQFLLVQVQVLLGLVQEMLQDLDQTFYTSQVVGVNLTLKIN